MVRIKCIKLDKCPICGDKGRCQVFFNKRGNVKYGRVKHIIHKNEQGYNPNIKYNFRYCKLEDLQIETLLTSLNFQFPIAEAQSLKVGQVYLGTSEKIHDQISVSLLSGQADSGLNLKMAGPLGFEPRTFSLEG
jgi:hypothetical protein